MCYLGEATVSVLFKGSSVGFIGEAMVSVLFRGSSGECVI